MKNGALRLGDICWLHSAVIDGWLKIEKQHIPSSEHIGLTIVEYRLISDEFSKLYSSLMKVIDWICPTQSTSRPR